jgi:hypothetical protein
MVYYIKPAANVPDEGKELMSHVYECCLEGNPDDKHIFSSGTAAHIQTDIKFQQLTPSIKGDADITTFIKIMKCGTLETQFLSRNFSSSGCCTLLRFKDESLEKIHTILSFKFNTIYDCVEVVTFCCDDVGGGTIFNFLINAVNCGVNRCDPASEYERKIILSSLPEAKSFYRKYGFKRSGTTPVESYIFEKLFHKKSQESAIIPIQHPAIEEIKTEIIERSISGSSNREEPPQTRKRIRSEETPQSNDSEDRPTTKHGGTIKNNKKQKRHTTKYKKRKSRQTKNKFTRNS